MAMTAGSPRRSAPRDDVLLHHLSDVLASCKLPEFPHLAVAVSGGADSMALALLLHQAGHRITALTVDHGLRKESAAEAKQVGKWMQVHGIAHHILTPAPMDFIPNIQTRAREMRYAALTGWCREHKVDALMLAHHADDQAETVELQKHRGDSSPSRSGMALVRERSGIKLIRPLLGVRKSQLIDYLQAHKQAWVEDPSNASQDYARNRLRGTLDANAIHALWHEAQEQGALRHAEDVARNAWALRHITEEDGTLRFHLGEWRALVAEMGTDLLSRAIQAVGRSKHRSRLHESVRLAFLLRSEDDGKETLGGTLIEWGDGHVAIRPEPKRLRALEADAEAPHMLSANPLKLLASEPFWWFNHRPLFE